MSFVEEFKTVDLILNSEFETRGVDAFSLSLIKAERQIRKIFTFLVYQSPHFSPQHVDELKQVLEQNRQCYFEGFENGINQISVRKVQDMVGERYQELRPRLELATSYRNKIFHGQLTNQSLGREHLISLAQEIRSWSKLLSDGSFQNFGYDGFMRNSFRKSEVDIQNFLKLPIFNVNEYAALIANHVRRNRQI